MTEDDYRHTARDAPTLHLSGHELLACWWHTADCGPSRSAPAGSAGEGSMAGHGCQRLRRWPDAPGQSPDQERGPGRAEEAAGLETAAAGPAGHESLAGR